MLADWLITPLQDARRREPIQILDDRYKNRSTLISSKLPVEKWRAPSGIQHSPTPSSTVSSTILAAWTCGEGECLRSARRIRMLGLSTNACKRRTKILTLLSAFNWNWRQSVYWIRCSFLVEMRTRLRKLTLTTSDRTRSRLYVVGRVVVCPAAPNSPKETELLIIGPNSS